MRTVHVDLNTRSYDILIAPHLLREAGSHFKECGFQKRIFLVTNTTVFALHGEKFVGSLESEGFQVTEIFVPDGEKFKNLHTVDNIYTYLIAQRADRTSVIAAMGGGVTGDMAGFAAASYLRGVSFVQIPTTLLSQVDSSVGGKTGVNHPHGKNMIGAFYQPKLVIIDTDTLSTLPDREFRSGMYEVLKYGLISDAKFFDYLEASLGTIMNRTPQALERVISRCCEIKSAITTEDEREKGLRRILNFGHTFAHALEVASDFRHLTHGEAVAYGMLAASDLSVKMGYIDKSTSERIASVIRNVGPLPPIDHISVIDLMEAMEMDKKREAGNKVFVLLREIGTSEVRGQVKDEIVASIWKEVISSASGV